MRQTFHHFSENFPFNGKWAPLVLTLTNFRVIDPYAPVSTFDNDLCSHQQHSQPLEKLETLKPSQSSLEDPAQTIRVSTD
ncbi:hypothetical protein AAC387_Pa08g1583 [Persea americana]